MLTLKFKEYSLELPKEVYLPSDDTYLMLNTLEKEIISKNHFFENALEIGSGNGFLSLCVYNNVQKITSVDLNPIVVDYLNNIKDKYSLTKQKILLSDLFSALDKNNKFDLIIFNPPYVPSDPLTLEKGIDPSDPINLEKGIDLAVNGGKDGLEIITKFLTELDSFLSKNGICYLLVSSLNKINKIKKQLSEKRMTCEIIASKKLFFEELFVLKISFS